MNIELHIYNEDLSLIATITSPIASPIYYRL